MVNRRLVLSACLFVPLALWDTVKPAAAETRLALVIGNSDYSNVTKLPNPTNDARLIASSLELVGFTTITAVNAKRRDFLEAIKSFVGKIDSDTVVVFYYAGHGIQYHDENFLLPIDTEVRQPGDLPFEGVSLKAITDELMEAKPHVAILILDACRDNPLKGGAKNSKADFDDGLAKMPGAVGTFIAFATAPGAAAMDGADADSPFSKALASYISKPGLPIEQVFKRVRETVVDKTDGLQVPWDNTSLITDFFFVSAMGDEPEVVRMSEADATAWRDASTADTLKAYKGYISKYPDGLFSDLATAHVRAIEEPPKSETPKSGNEKRGLSSVADLSDWNKANKVGSSAAYKDYLVAHPDGFFAKLARLRIEDTSTADLANMTPITTVQTPNFQEFVENPLYPEVTDCDRLAGHVQEAADPAVGVFFGQIEPAKAVPVCQHALEQYPDSLRILTNYARAIDAAGRHEEARALYQAGAEAGFPIAYRSLGDVYRDGRGVEKDLKEARYWYALGAEKYNVFAELNLALIYEGGLGVPVNKSKAVQWLWRSASQGFAPSMEKLAGYYLNGDVVPKDERQAAILLQGAAEMGHIWAEQRLGELYISGTGVKADPLLGREWIERSATQGNAYAQVEVAKLYRDGVGGKSDAVVALKWLYLAKKGGAVSADEALSELEAKVSKKQLKQAKLLASRFAAKPIK
ncbi:caspase family protein [Mesorhizobium sp. RSR565B]|uniref:caspase family protein n=1 Tax=unclassified Mesorhizobium TaxID=325217 RepID=UPI0003CEE3E6|nr:MULTISPECIES: caspase family protein [unclassified Mesorhizobium]ESY07311.1 peptidase C14, caspase catalytic subunit p20 [Mesorhizobium sp. LNJC399B00]ESZ43586.1 peptidase C14, caspase catalytic subunit p20 [Mesorhizobium sp. L103C565B0]WJI70608.1 caspase family protein [Mesorhizobium sp. C399B]